MPDLSNPVIVQSDRSVLLEVLNPLFEEARDTLAIFAELEKSPEYAAHRNRQRPSHQPVNTGSMCSVS